MAKFLGAFGTCMVWLAFSGTAWADEPPPTPPPPMAPMPPPRPAPVYIPTADERAMAVRASTSDCTTCPSCAPCGREACFQVRDNCGWPTDACGKRRGCLEIELQGGISWFSDPDGQLGEVVAGNTAPLNWNDLDY